MALTIVGAIASISALFGTIGYFLGLKEGVQKEKERATLSALTAKQNMESTILGEEDA